MPVTMTSRRARPRISSSPVVPMMVGHSPSQRWAVKRVKVPFHTPLSTVIGSASPMDRAFGYQAEANCTGASQSENRNR